MDRAAGRLGEVYVVEPDATQSAEKHIGHRGKPRAQLAGAHVAVDVRSAKRSA
jgi:hypothetical protein